MSDTASSDAALAARFAEIAEQSQRIVQAFWERQAEEARERSGFTLLEPNVIRRAFLGFGARLMANPARLAQAQSELIQANVELWHNTLRRMMGEEMEPLVRPERGDRRFHDKAWNDELLFDYVKQSYLLTARWLHGLVKGTEHVDPKTREKVEFYTRQFISAAAPSNFVLTNPAVLRKVQETGGQSLVAGLEHLLNDLERGRGRLKISMTDAKAFEIGRNVATMPGKVIYQNDLMQLIQYAPTTDKVYRRPYLIVPAWINKFYILDLQPRNSYIKYMVDHGHTVFLISWKNPNEELAHKSFEDYMIEGPLAALDVIEQATGEHEVNALGFCIGGILIASTLGYLAAKGDERIKSTTFFTSLFDFNEVGEVSVFIDDEQIEHMRDHVEEKGYLEGDYMASMFNLMRENDLIWSFVVNNYLMGREPPPFDLLYWNSDATRLPATMLLFYIKEMYKNNALSKPGRLKLDGVPIDLGKVTVPVYIFAARGDHIAPWRSCYPGTQLFGGPKRFVLSASGHIAGVINPPAAKKYSYWTNPELPPTPEEWLEGAELYEGSWWPDQARWLGERGGPKVPARQPGDGPLQPIEDAPGSYVRERASN